MGQVNNLPQCTVTCPNADACLPAALSVLRFLLASPGIRVAVGVGGPKCVWVWWFWPDSGGFGGTQTLFGPHARQAPVLARDSDAFWTTPARRHPDSQWSPKESGRRMCSGRACARIGVGYGALGQVINLPQWGLSCPSRWFRAPMLFVGFGRVPWWGWRLVGSLIWVWFRLGRWEWGRLWWLWARRWWIRSAHCPARCSQGGD